MRPIEKESPRPPALPPVSQRALDKLKDELKGSTEAKFRKKTITAFESTNPRLVKRIKEEIETHRSWRKDKDNLLHGMGMVIRLYDIDKNARLIPVFKKLKLPDIDEAIEELRLQMRFQGSTHSINEGLRMMKGVLRVIWPKLKIL